MSWMFFADGRLSNTGAKFTGEVKYMTFEWDDVLDFSLEYFAGHTLQITPASAIVRGDAEERELERIGNHRQRFNFVIVDNLANVMDVLPY